MTTITPLALPEVLLITPKRHGDARGWFMETWSRRAFAQAGLDIDFVFEGDVNHVRLGGADVTAAIRTPEASTASSKGCTGRAS